MFKIVCFLLFVSVCCGRTVPGKFPENENEKEAAANESLSGSEEKPPTAMSEGTGEVVETPQDTTQNSEAPSDSDDMVVPEEPQENPSLPEHSIPDNIEPQLPPTIVDDDPAEHPGDLPTPDELDEPDDCENQKPKCHSRKVLMCHNLANNPHEICVNKSAVKAHEKHGDKRGKCNEN